MVADERSRLLEILARTSFRCADIPKFHLASGAWSKYYVDCKFALSDPEARRLIGKLICDVAGQDFDAVGGLEIGAYPIATAVSDRVYDTSRRKVRAFVVRKEPKSHGIAGLLAGDARKGDTTLIVDDVITTGSSTIKALENAREAGLIVARVVVLVDRQDGNGQKNIEARGVGFDSLFNLNELIDASQNYAATDAPTHPAGLGQTESH